tara:strand:+ start:5254 stop:5853 length:600 start_codon:yes stop_codon:yes gene_type:complete
MKTSEAVNEIAKALCAAQGEMDNAQKNMTNTHFKNTYADLSEVLNAVRPALSKAGIAFVQMTAIEGDAMVLHTRLIHTSGQWLESVHPIAKLPATPQQIGAGETYARRYSLAAICGIGQEDDDLGDGKKAAPAGAAAIPQKTRESLIADGTQCAKFSLAALESWWKTKLTTTERELVTMATLAELKEVAIGSEQQEAVQ